MLTKRLIIRFVFTTLIAASLFFTRLGLTPAYAAGITVNTAMDELTTNGSCSLREAIINANNNNQSGSTDCASGSGIDPIGFAANYTITLAGELPLVTSEIVINGKGAGKTIIQASTCNPVTLPGGCTPATYRVFKVYITGYLTLNGLTVRHGQCAGACTGNGDRGGGIHSGGHLTVTNSTISGNNATDAGGGISSGGPLFVINSTISGNNAPDGGGIFSGDNDLTIMDSTISGNSATDGGGIFAAAGFAENIVSITNSIFSGNHAANNGGGIYNRNYLGVLDSTLSGNSATNGGGIYNDTGHHLEMRKSTLSGNTAAMGGGIYNHGTLWMGNGTLSGNEAYNYGGGIYSNGSTWIYNSTIVFNTLVERTFLAAGGIHGDAHLSNSIVAGNTILISSEYRDCSGTMYLEGVNAFWNTTNCSMNPGSPGYSTHLYSLNELGPLQANGGPTWTHALIPIEEGSRVIDAGDNTVCASGPVYNLDQRGVTRPQGSRCDVGAYEYQESTTPATATFGDVPTNHWAWMFVERLANAGITDGCSGGNYCPDGSVTRAQMAIFLLRGIHGSSYIPPAVGGSTGFGDVATNYWAAAWIKQLAAEGITGGCGSGNYCPEASVTRAQMSIFLLRSKYGSSYNPPAAGGSTGFGDVAPNYWAAAWIKQLVAEGITAGCGNGNYCPESAVTRAQMAVFLVRTFNLP